MSDKPGFLDRRKGEQINLGFSVGKGRTGKVKMVRDKRGGRKVMSVEMEDGAELFVTRRNGEWEGRLISKDLEKAWKVHGRGRDVSVEEVSIDRVMCARQTENGMEGGMPTRGVPVDGPSLLSGEPDPTPIFSSLPGANGVIYLDFDGETVSDTQWNTSYNDGAPIDAMGPGYSASEVEDVWKRVSEDFRPFNVNVTTDRAAYNAAPVNRRTMVIFTPDNEWYGESGGVAYVDVFGSELWDEPVWVFTDQLSNVVHWAAEAASHEAGHALGLEHDGTASEDYYEGHGSGSTSWGPIMGASYDPTVTHWSKGEYSGANNLQDDLAVIASARNGLGYRVDLHGDSTGDATPMTSSGTDAVSASGIIETNTDIDVFSFATEGGTVSLTANNGDTDPNLDIRLRLLDSTGAELLVVNPQSSLDAGFSQNLGSGVFYVEVTGTGKGDLISGYSDYGSLGGYTISGTVPVGSALTTTILSPAASEVSVAEGTGLVLDGQVIGGTLAWEVVSTPAGGNVDLSDPSAGTTRASFDLPGVYQLRLKGSNGAINVEDLLTVAVDPVGGPTTYSVVAPGIDLGGDGDVYVEFMDLLPVVTDDGPPGGLSYEWSVLSGSGELSATGVLSPELFFPFDDEAVRLRLVVDDGANRSFGEVELTARYAIETLVSSSSLIKVQVPTSDTLGSTWQEIGFDDSAWTGGPKSVGFDAAPGPPGTQLYSFEIGIDVLGQMYGQQAGCYLRVPFDVEDPARVLSIAMYLKYDDGFVAYVNGVEVARDNVPSGPASWGSTASSDRSDTSGREFEWFDLSIPEGVLVSGANVLAIHGMNPTSASTDFRFLLAPELDVVIADVAPVPPTPFELAASSISDPAQRGAGSDPDEDGRSNLREHAAGTLLSTFDDGYRMVLVQKEDEAIAVLPDAVPGDVRYILQYSLDMKDPWVEVARRDGMDPWTGTAPTSTTAMPDNRTGHVFPIPDGPNCLVRMRIELLTP